MGTSRSYHCGGHQCSPWACFTAPPLWVDAGDRGPVQSSHAPGTGHQSPAVSGVTSCPTRHERQGWSCLCLDGKHPRRSSMLRQQVSRKDRTPSSADTYPTCPTGSGARICVVRCLPGFLIPVSRVAVPLSVVSSSPALVDGPPGRRGSAGKLGVGNKGWDPLPRDASSARSRRASQRAPAA